MQTNIDIVRSYYIAVDQGDLVKAFQYLSDDFRRTGSTTGTMGKQEWFEVLNLLQTAMPNLKHALSNYSAEGSVVKITVQAGGRHTQPLDLSHLGMGISEGIAPGSGKMVIFLPEVFEYTVSNGKITAERNVTPVSLHNGVTGFLNALGFSG